MFNNSNKSYKEVPGMFHAIKILNRRIRCILLLSLGFAALVFMGPVAALGAGPAPELENVGDVFRPEFGNPGAVRAGIFT